MHRKLTITLDEAVYEALHRKVGRGRISQFVEDLVRPYVLPEAMEAAYREMATDTVREREALEWSEATSRDAADDEAG